jgi:hypothetical protein
MENTEVKITFEDIGIKKAPKLADTHLGKVRNHKFLVYDSSKLKIA